MIVEVKESTIVHPAEETAKHQLWLSNMDMLQATSNVVPTVYLYEPDGSANFFEAQVLKEALRKVLVPFYPVAGRLGRNENGRLEINCNEEGVLFVEAETNSAISDLGEFLPGKELQQLLPTIDYSAGIASFPLCVSQVTRFKCGGVSLGIGLHHILGDGVAGLHFIISWCRLARGLSIDIPPVLDRTFLRARVPPKPKFPHIEYHPNPDLNKPIQNSSDPAATVLTITLNQLNTLKAKARGSKASKPQYSTFEVLSAHIWRCACKARVVPNDQLNRLRISVDGRTRLYPPVPPGFFGNVVFSAAAIVLAGDLVSESIATTAERIHKAIKGMDDEYLRSAVDYLEEQVDHIETLIDSLSTRRSPTIKINSWSRLPFFDCDFGWGAPSLIRRAATKEGWIYIQPSAGNDGSFSVFVCLDADHMPSFKKLFYDL